MKVSIVTPVYNSRSYSIIDCVNSVHRQTYEDIEHIIIDGASTDATLEILDCLKNKDKFSLLISEKDKGIYDAMNKGIKLATGDIVGILNSDDFYVSKYVIEKVVRIFKEEKVDAVYADLLYVDSIEIVDIKRYWKSGEFKKESFKYGWMPPHPTFFVKKEIYEKYGYYNLDLKSAADYELMLRLLYKYEIKVSYLNDIIIKMRDGGSSGQSLRHRLFANREDKKAWKINSLKPLPFTLVLKPIRKLKQYFIPLEIKEKYSGLEFFYDSKIINNVETYDER